MSEEQPKSENSNLRTIVFMVALSFVCALILSVIASALAGPQQFAQEVDRSKQMLIAAKVLDHRGFFLIENEKGEHVPAKLVGEGILEPTEDIVIASQTQILEIYNKRMVPLLVDRQGKISTFKELGIDQPEYINDYRKTGYYKLPQMLVYKVLPNLKKGETVEPANAPAVAYVIPVNGFGLWDAIYGYLAIAPDGDTVIGITWYQQKETPGLGAEIAEPHWQMQFPGKLIFQENAEGKTDFKTDPLGITVVRGKVSEVLGNSPKAKSAVDGISGATLTGNGVTQAYKDTLAPYRPFLIRIHDEQEKKK